MVGNPFRMGTKWRHDIAGARSSTTSRLALAAGGFRPERRETCFFDPRRLAGGEATEIRMIRVGDRRVPVRGIGGGRR